MENPGDSRLVTEYGYARKFVSGWYHGLWQVCLNSGRNCIVSSLEEVDELLNPDEDGEGSNGSSVST